MGGTPHPRGRTCVVGNLLVDLLVRGVPALPAWGREVAGTGHAAVASGQAGYMALALGALDAPVSVVSVLGADADGALVRDALAAAGVDVAGVETSAAGATALTVAIVRPDGERAFVSDFACLRELDGALLARHRAAVEQASTVALVGLFNLPGLTLDAARALLAAARAAGRRAVLDTGWDPAGWPAETVDGVLAMLADVDLFLPNGDEARVLTGLDDPADAAARLAERCPGLVVVKDGAGGCHARLGDRAWHAPAARVAVHDTVGAGDTFDAALVHALDGGWPVDRALAWANATAGLYVSRAHDRFPAAADVAAALPPVPDPDQEPHA